VDLLMNHRWPGNVRELKNVIESSVVLCRGEMITPDDIHLHDLGRTDEDGDGLNPLEAQERAMVLDALKKAKWVQKDAADILGISRRVMHYKIKKFKIQADKKLA